MNAIEIKNLSKSYKEFELKNINLTLPKGYIMGLIGKNGAGKSTLINLIMGAIAKNSGEVKVMGMDNTSKDFVNLKNDIGVVLDEAAFNELLNSKQINKIMSYTYKNWDEKMFFNYLKQFSIGEKKLFKEMSKGMKMKLLIAVALCHKAKLLVFDEATSGLDPIAREEILDILNEFTRSGENTVLLSSHIISDLEKICDYICFIKNGELLFCDEKDILLEKYSLLKVSEDQLKDIPKDAIVGKRANGYGLEVLIFSDKVSNAFEKEHTTLEDIMIFSELKN